MQFHPIINLSELQFKQILRNPVIGKELILYLPIYVIIWIFLVIKAGTDISLNLMFWFIILSSNVFLIIRISVILIGLDAALIGYVFTSPIQLRCYFLAKTFILQSITSISIIFGILIFIISKINFILLCATSATYFMGTLIYPLLAIQLVHFQPIKKQESIVVNVSVLYIVPILLFLLLILNVVYNLPVESQRGAYLLVSLPGIIGISLQSVWIKGLVKIYFRNKYKIYNKAQLP